MSTITALPSRARTLVASLTTALLVFGGLSLAPSAAVAAVGDISGGTLTWGTSAYLNAGSPGRPGPLASGYVAPSTFDATTRLSSWGAATGTIAPDGSATLAFDGTSLNFAPTGGGWLKLTDAEVVLDASGNGTLSAVVAYGTSVTGTPGALTYDPAQAPTRPAARVDVMTLVGNAVPVTRTGTAATWSGLTGSWSPAFAAYLSGDAATTPAIPAWTYATTISSAAGRTPLPVSIGLNLVAAPAYTPSSYDLGTATWGLSSYLNSANPGRPNPLAAGYGTPATFDATTRLSSWGAGSGTVAADGSATISYTGTSVNFASTGGGWLKLTDPRATLDAKGNGSVTALVAYGTSVTGTPGALTFDPNQAPTRATQRLTVVTLGGNTAYPTQSADTIAWTGLAGSWSPEFTAYLAGDGAGIPAWTYATTISAAAGRTPLPFDFVLGTAPAVTPTIALTTSPTGGVIVGANVTLSAKLSPVAAGTVTFRNGSTVLGSAAVSASGAASLVLAAPSAGDYSFSASFAPADPSDFTTATSAPVSFSVDRPVASSPGSLTWGVKSSLRNYVLGGGSISTSGGAGTSGGVFVFPQAANSFNHAAQTGSANYSGRVTFAYPAHQFSIGISNPRVAITSANAGLLIADVTFNGSTSSGVTFATLSFGAANHKTVGTTTTFSNVSATLTAAGAATFAGFYSAGQSMDPVSFVIGRTSTGFVGTSQVADEEDKEWAAPPTPPATTGIETDSTEYEVGGEFTGNASGFQPNEEDIRVVLYSDPIILAEGIVADAAGVVRWSGALPAGLEGTHTVTFQGSVSRGIPITIMAPEVTTLEGCDVQDAAISWGFKESFRSYISGSIAKGEWTVADGATYSVPNFGFAEGTGIYNAGSGVGLVTFDGSIRFTGHDGLLDTTVSNPQLRFVDANSAILLLDVSGDTQDGAAVDLGSVEFVTLDLGAVTVTNEDGVITITDAPTELTQAGSDAFGTYDAGEAFDALSVTFSTPADCAVAPVDAPSEEAPVAAVVPDLTWLLWLTIALLLIAAVVVLVVVRRRRQRS